MRPRPTRICGKTASISPMQPPLSKTNPRSPWGMPSPRKRNARSLWEWTRWAGCGRGLHVARRPDPADLSTSGHPARMAPVRGKTMKKEYDSSKAKRGPVVKTAAGKTRITIRLDNAALAWFRDQAHAAGGGSYQSLINDNMWRQPGSRWKARCGGSSGKNYGRAAEGRHERPAATPAHKGHLSFISGA